MGGIYITRGPTLLQSQLSLPSRVLGSRLSALGSRRSRRSAKLVYQKLIDDCILKNRSRILAFKTAPEAPASKLPQFDEPIQPQKNNNVLAIGLEDAVYLWDAANESTKLLQPVEDRGSITCIHWSPDCAVLAVAFGNSDLALIDPATGHVMDGMEDENQAPVLSLAWRSNSILTVGRFDGTVVDYDFRKDDMFICFYNGHRRRVCSLKWSMLSGRYLASGGQDKLVHIWDACMLVSRDHPRQRQWLHRISSHTSIVKAVDWCPTRSNLLASGGGCNNNCVKFWNTVNGACLNSIDVGSEVCALLWDKNKSELLTSHGSPNNQLTLWNYPSMTRVVEVSGHSSWVLSLAGSPLGGVVASAAADETIRSVVGNITMGSFVVSKRHIFIQAHGFEIFKYERNRLRYKDIKASLDLL
ncbi:cell division cycle 20.2, cofactor of APC complex-like [Musa acuminata AAA Group]|uniref:cell division cycle 20.2, cofactor of APC complex-like n=2 Tax=Musa acuminata AAA Group TaxID=214697 RepID=UPI0031D64ACD